MDNKPLLTVITVTYNSSLYIRDAIDSILNSSYSQFELIVGDDHSSDNTWDIIQTYQDTRIRRYRNEHNLGEYSNRNKALSLAVGQYVIFIDGDDMVYAHGLEFMVRMLHAFPQCGMALMRWFKNDLFYPVVISPEQFYIGEYFGNGFLGTAFSNVLFNTEILKNEGGMSLDFKAGDDFIRYKIAAKYPSVLINDGLTWWRETPGQASQKLSKSAIASLEVYRMKFFFLESPSCPLSFEMKALARRNVFLTLAKRSLKLFLKMQFYAAYVTLQKFDVPLKFILGLYKRPVSINPFSEYSPSKPFRMALQDNPYSNESDSKP